MNSHLITPDCAFGKKVVVAIDQFDRARWWNLWLAAPRWPLTRQHH